MNLLGFWAAEDTDSRHKNSVFIKQSDSVLNFLFFCLQFYHSMKIIFHVLVQQK